MPEPAQNPIPKTDAEQSRREKEDAQEEEAGQHDGAAGAGGGATEAEGSTTTEPPQSQESASDLLRREWVQNKTGTLRKRISRDAEARGGAEARREHGSDRTGAPATAQNVG